MEPVFLQVTPIVNGSNIQLQLCHDKDCGNSPGTYPSVSLDANSGGHVFIVSITDPSQGVKFASDAVWVHAAHGSPAKQGLNNNGQIGSFTKANDTTIFFTDANNNDPKNPMTLGYSLHFKAPNGNDLVLDPDIKNGGGTSLYSSAFAMGSLVLGVATLAAILYVAFQQSIVKRMIAGLIGSPRPK